MRSDDVSMKCTRTALPAMPGEGQSTHMRTAPRRIGTLARVLAPLLAGLSPLAAAANPAGGVVHAGAATIDGQGTGVVTVNQQSTSAVLSWQSFNIEPGETTNFRQPGADAIAINRILDNNASAIFGSLRANGTVYLINPNGILFGPGSQVDVGGLAAGTSYKAGQQMIQNGFDPSARSADGASIVNQGTIRTRDGGFVYLVAPKVENGENGVIVSPGGHVSIAAGATVYLTDRTDGRGVQVAYTAPGASGSTPLSEVLAQQSFASLRAGALRQAGVVEADAARERGGKIELYAQTSLDLADGSRTSARGAAEGAATDGGTITALSDAAAAVAPGALIDVSAGGSRGDGGSLEVSAKSELSLSGTFRAAGEGGGAGGAVVIDPLVSKIGSASFSAGSVTLHSTDSIQIDPGARIRLEAGAGARTFAVRAKNDVTFGDGSSISDETDATPAADRERDHWNVELVAGAVNPSAAGDLATSGNGSLTVGSDTGGGRVSLRTGTITARAAGDVVIGSDGGLVAERGDIDVEAGRSVRFTASSTLTDGVIENGSGNIRVVAGDSVTLSGRDARGGLVDGNAAIRTRGLLGHVDLGTPGCTNDPSGCDTRTGGGSIFVQAIRGDVDAGIGNRWLDVGSPNPDDFDPMPVYHGGILGIGTEAGGNVTVIAGRDVLTGLSTRTRSGGSASGLLYKAGVNGYGYDGGHIGVFGAPAIYDIDYNTPTGDLLRARPFGIALESLLTVVAGRNVTGDYMARNGKALIAAGYDATVTAQPPGIAPVVALRASDTALRYPDAAAGDADAGWAGTLARPLTVDLVRGSVSIRGQNGVALRAIENPSLVYQPANEEAGGTYRVPTYGATDTADVEAVTGDVMLIGGDNLSPRLPMPASDPRFPGDQAVTFEDDVLSRLLPPSLRVTTHPFARGAESRGGDLVLLSDFVLFPSTTGGLTLDVAGSVRTANGTASGAAELVLDVRTVGAAKEQRITLPLGTRLVDPSVPGLEYVLSGSSAVVVARRLDAQAALGSVRFQAARAALSGPIRVPKGTRVAGINGQIYETTTAFDFPAPTARVASGEVLFHGAAGARIPEGTRLVGSDGTVFRVVSEATIVKGSSYATVQVRADTPGRDAQPLSLRLADSLSGIESATNFKAVSRPTTFDVPVQAVATGLAGNVSARRIPALLTPIPGIESVVNTNAVSGGAEIAASGRLVNSSAPRAVARVLGPVGEVALGHTLRIADPSVLPAGVSPDDIVITASSVAVAGSLAPSVQRSLHVQRSGGVVVSTRPDTDPGVVVGVNASDVWQRIGGGNSATLLQSDASPETDQRISGARFDYDRYYQLCHAGAACLAVSDPLTGAPVSTGAGPTHTGGSTSASLRADSGFDRVRFDLAQPAILETNGNVHDTALLVQHTAASDTSAMLVPYGNASFGAGTTQLVDRQLGREISVLVPGDPTSGFQIAGPGSALVQVGVSSFDEADRDGNGVITRDEFGGSDEAFDAIDRASHVIATGRLGRSDLPAVPTGRGGAIGLAASSKSPSSAAVLGIESVGNARNSALAAGGASLSLTAAGSILLNDRGSIGSLQGGRLSVRSLGGSVLGGEPATTSKDKRGIYSLYAASRLTTSATPPLSSGGGSIDVVAFGDINPGRSAIAALSGGDITLATLSGSVKAGFGKPFKNAAVQLDPNTGLPRVSYEGAGIAATGGTVTIKARRDVNIGAGITGAGIVIHAGGSITAGTGAIASTGNVSLSAGGTIGGTISAAGSVSVGSGTVSQTANVSAGGVVTGAGAAVSNASVGARASAETGRAADAASAGAETGTSGGRSVSAGPAGPRKGVIIDVELERCDSERACNA